MFASPLSRVEKILILAKTYPTPSAKHVETSCIAGITENQEMRRLYPVPFRLLDQDLQFKKWEWIEVETYANSQDARKESRKIDYFSIRRLAEIRTQKKKNKAPSWEKRARWIKAIPEVTHFKPEKGNDICVEEGNSLALYSMPSVFHLEIRQSEPEFTKEQMIKFKIFENENSLFTPEEAGLPKFTLRKIPYDFYYVFNAKTSDTEDREIKLKITDWESGALYFNCLKSHGKDWQEPFRARMESYMKTRDLKLLLGNIHQYPNQWLAVSLLYPPKTSTGEAVQGSLF